MSNTNNNEMIEYSSVYLTGPEKYGFLIPIDGTTVANNQELTVYCPLYANKTVRISGMNNGAVWGDYIEVVFDANGYYTYTPNYQILATDIRFVCFDAETTADSKFYVVVSEDTGGDSGEDTEDTGGDSSGGSGSLPDSNYNVILSVDTIYLSGPARYGFLLPFDDTKVIPNQEITVYCPLYANQIVKIVPMHEDGTKVYGTPVDYTFDNNGYLTFTPSYPYPDTTHTRFVCFDVEITEQDKLYVVTDKNTDDDSGGSDNGSDSGNSGISSTGYKKHYFKSGAKLYARELNEMDEQIYKNANDIANNLYLVNKSITQAKNKGLKILFASDIHLGVEDQTSEAVRLGYTDEERMDILVDRIKYENSLGTIDCIIFAGDQTSNTMMPDAVGGVEKDFLPEFIERMKAIGIPFYCTNGNHELYTDEEWKALFGYGSNYVISIKDYDIIVLNNYTDTSAELPTSTGYLLSDISEETKTSILNYLNASDKQNAIIVSHYCYENTMHLPNTSAVAEHEKVLFVINGHVHNLINVGGNSIGGKTILNCGNFSVDQTGGTYFSYRIFKDEDGKVESYAVKPACDYEVNGEIVSVEYEKVYSKTFKDESVNYGIDIIKA